MKSSLLRSAAIDVVRPSSMFKATVLASLGVGLPGQMALAQDATTQVSESTDQAEGAPADGGLDVIVVTARKRAEELQDVPVAITAFNSEQLDDRFFRDVSDLSYAAPNVNLDSSGTTKGIANFSVRGLGITASIPTIDPSVGTFVDGVYLGVNYGVVLDMFDLESVEILRGPQGLLFGRNTTGGAVLLTTRAPANEFRFRARGAIESGPQTILAASVEGPIIEGVLSAKLSGYYADDQGYFENQFNGNEDFGADETYIIRPAVVLTPADNLEIDLRFETGETNADGTVSQNRILFDNDTFDVSQNTEGFADISWDQATATVNWDVGLGDGTITNIFGYRQVRQESLSDIDSLPTSGFDAFFFLDQEQYSNELRYSGRFFDRLDFTTGVFYFTQDVIYRERRELLGGVVASDFGGDQGHDVFGVFALADFELTDAVTLTLGLRYSEEDKSVRIARFDTTNPPCNFQTRQCVFADPNDPDVGFEPTASYSNFTPKVGLQWEPTEDVQAYASWTRGFRSGGYSVRVTDGTGSPGPFDEEQLDAYELGFKADWLNGRLRTNLAVFLNDISDLQRTVRVPDPQVGVVQTIANTADATIKGLEFEASAVVADGFIVEANLGLLDGDYDRVLFDISGDGVVDETDLALDLPRLAPLSYGIGFSYTHEFANGSEIALRSNYDYRDSSASTDNNAPGSFLSEANILNASITWTSPTRTWGVSVYGKNLLDDVTEDAITPLPAVVGGGTLAPLNKGVIFGAELSVDF